MSTRRPLVIAAGSIKELPAGDVLPVAAADVSNSPTGTISAGTVQAALNELDTEKGPYASGFVNRTDTTLAFDAGTRVFTLTKVNDFSVYAGGKRYEYIASQTTTLANSTGLHFIYIDTDGVLKNGTAAWDIGAGTQAPVATVYYNTAGPAAIGPFDERHSYLRNALAHSAIHNTVGAYWQTGYAGTFGDTDGSLSITAGTYYDEDIAHVSGDTVTQAKLIYRSSGAWIADALNADIREQIGGILQYDNSGTLANVTLNNYANYWVFVVNTPTPEIHVVVGQTLFTSSATAISESITALTLPPWITAEGKLLYRITYQRTAGTPAGDIFQTPTDFRTLRLSGGSTTGNVTNGDAHDHLGGDGAQIAHSSLSEIGTNTHAQIDSHLASSANPHSVTADQVLPAQTGNSGKFLTTNATTASWASIPAADWVYSAKSADYTILAADRATVFYVSGTTTLTFSAPATLGAGWFAIVKNNGTAIVTLSHTSGQIDGLNSYLIYPGDTRFVQCDGSTLRSILLAGGRYTWDSGVSSFTVPPGIVGLAYRIWGSGAGGGSGRKGAVGSYRGGGIGGGGGSCHAGEYLPVPTAGTVLDIVVGAGGSGGTAITANDTSGGAGGAGSPSQFGAYYAYGGRGGPGGTTTQNDGAGGAGVGAAFGTYTYSGGPPGGTDLYPNSGHAGGGTSAPAFFGGGGGSRNYAPMGGGGSIHGGAGGGNGGTISVANAAAAGGAGGGTSWAQGGGGAAGATQGASGTAGSDRCGGGGGYPSTSGNAGSGGAGGAPGGAGGGGGAAVNDVGNAGAGGAGASGRVVVWYY